MEEKQPNGYVLYDGPSLLSGTRIVVIATGFEDPSQNKKTGPMIQTWILVADQPPTEAAFNGQDYAVCGDCKFRYSPGIGRACYVNVGQGPLAVWRTWKKGGYRPLADPDAFRSKLVRIGSYGDPAAVPVGIWTAVTDGCQGYTGYTHQWRTAPAELSKFCMASADSDDERDAARSLGYRTFRVRGADDLRRHAGEAVCPASPESRVTRQLQCWECLACCGTEGQRRGDIVISARGSSGTRAAFKRVTHEIVGRGSEHAAA